MQLGFCFALGAGLALVLQGCGGGGSETATTTQAPTTTTTTADVCPTYDVMSDFDVTAYLGTWYEQAVTKLFYERFNQTCTVAKYSANDDGTIKVDNSAQKGERGALGPRAHVLGTARLADASSGEARLLVSITSTDSPYDILRTDYTSYAIVYACQVVGGKRLDTGFVLTREVDPDVTRIIDMAKGEYSKVGVDFDAVFERDIQGEAGTCTYDESQILA